MHQIPVKVKLTLVVAIPNMVVKLDSSPSMVMVLLGYLTMEVAVCGKTLSLLLTDIVKVKTHSGKLGKKPLKK